MDADILITKQDLRAVRNGAKRGYCIPGLRIWAAQNGMSFDSMMKNGVRESQLAHITDPFKDQIIAAARIRVAAEKAAEQ